MNIDTSTLFAGGINAMYRETGVKRQNLSAVANGHRGLSLEAARQVSAATKSETPVALYVASHSRAIKQRLDAGEGNAAALRAVAAVMDELKKIPNEDLLLEGDELKKTIAEMLAMLPETFTNATSAGGATSGEQPKTATKEAAESDRPRRDTMVRRTTQPSGSNARDPYGRAIR